MDRKRKAPATANGKNKKAKTDLSKESFMNDLKKFKLYTYEDRYYRDIRTEIGPLVLDWN